MLGLLGGIFHFYSTFNANSGGPDLVLHCSPMFHKKDSKLKRDKEIRRNTRLVSPFVKTQLSKKSKSFKTVFSCLRSLRQNEPQINLISFRD